MKKKVLNSPRLLKIKKNRHQILFHKLFFLFILFILFFIGLIFLSRWKEININNIQISGNKIIESEKLEEVIKEKITGYYFGIFPKTNFLLYPKKAIKNELSEKFKRLENISLNVKDFKTLDFVFSERTPLFIWCEDKPKFLNENTEEEKCYYMDKNGYIFDSAPYFSGEIYLKFYGDIKGDPYGSYFYQNNFQNLILLSETLKKINIKPVIFYIEDTDNIKMYLSSSSNLQLGPEVIFKSDADFNKVIENLQTVLTIEPLQSDFKNKYSSILSIDLRFGNKVYYKLR